MLQVDVETAGDRWELVMALRDRLLEAKRSLRSAGPSKKVELLNMKPYFERACKAATPMARGIVMGKLRASGVNSNTGTLSSAMNRVFLDLKWKGDRPVLSLKLPTGMGEEIYRRIWSLDHGYDNEKGHVKGRKIFTLTRSERSSIGREVEALAKSYAEQER